MVQVDTVLRCKYLLTMSDDSVKEDYAIAINDGKIIDVLPLEESDKKYDARLWRYLTNSIVMPGLVNSHNHSPMIFYRGMIPEGTPLDIVLKKYMFPIEARCSSEPEFVYYASKAAAIEMLNAGTTTTAEMYYHADAMMQAFKDVGIRAIVGETVMSVMKTPSAENANESIKLAEKAKLLDDGLVEVAIAPHAIYTVNDETLKLCGDACRANGMRMLMHANENDFEVNEVVKRRGSSYESLNPIGYLSRLGVFDNNKVTLAHCCKLDFNDDFYQGPDDLEYIIKYGLGVALNPVSNALTHAKTANAQRMLASVVRVGLGSDGPMTNDNIDMLSQLKPALLLYNNAGQKISSYDIVRMATIGSARALHLDDRIGTIEKGKEADIIALDLSSSAQPYMENGNLFQYIVRYAKPGYVIFMMVRGREIPLLRQDERKNSEMLSRVKLI